MSPDNGTPGTEDSDVEGMGGDAGNADGSQVDGSQVDGELGDTELVDTELVEDEAPGDVEPDEPAAIEEELVEDEVERIAARAPTRGPRKVGPFRRLYRGETSFDFVGRRRLWLTISAVVIVAGIFSLGVRGLNLGITFKGGQAWTVKAHGVSQTRALNVVEAAGLTQPTVELIGTGSQQVIRVTADLNSLTASQQHAEETRVIAALSKVTKQSRTSVSVTAVGPTWGGQVTQKAIIALIVFLVLVAVYISLRFEPKMAIAAFIALLHDLLVTAGVYSLTGFQVTPDTVIAVLTILGYSLYDTVVVFDRVRDNSKGLGATGRMTYSDMVNLSMNQTLARSINTSLVAILPVLSVLLIGAELLGATTLQNYGLALFVGLLSGAYSSIFIASPILAQLKEREPRNAAIRQRVESKGERLGLLTPRAAAALLGASAAGGAARRMARDDGGRTIRPGQAGTARRPAARAGGAATATLDADAPAAGGNGQARGNGAAAGSARTGSSQRQQRQPTARRPANRSRKGGKGKRRR